MEEVKTKYSHDEFMQRYLHQDIDNSYTKKEIEIAKKQVKIESYMLSNRILYEQEKEIVKYNIKKIAENVISWWEATNVWKLSELLEKNKIFI